MQIGVVDLHHIGGQIARRLLAGGHQCVVFDTCARRLVEVAAEKAYGAASLADLIHELDPPRAIWLTGASVSVDDTIATLLRHVQPGDLFVDSSASTYADARRRACDLARLGMDYVDVGLCGELARLDRPWCVTVGGLEATVRYLDPLLRQLADPSDRSPRSRRYLHCGGAGSGHFVAAIHDRVAGRLIAAYADGFIALREAEGSSDDQPYDLQAIAGLWRQGSLIGSHMLDLTARALAKDVAGADLSTSVLAALEQEGVAAGNA